MPSPDSYRLKSEFDTEPQGSRHIPKAKAFTFGAPREAYDKVYLPQQKMNLDMTMPGPDKYTLLSSFGKEGRKISL